MPPHGLFCLLRLGLAGTGRDTECVAQVFPECSPAEGGCQTATGCQRRVPRTPGCITGCQSRKEKHPEGAVRARAAVDCWSEGAADTEPQRWPGSRTSCGMRSWPSAYGGGWATPTGCGD